MPGPFSLHLGQKGRYPFAWEAPQLEARLWSLGPPLRPTQARMTPRIQEKAWPSKTQGRTSSYPGTRKTTRDRTESHEKTTHRNWKHFQNGLECEPIGKCGARRCALDLRARTHGRRSKRPSKNLNLRNFVNIITPYMHYPASCDPCK